MSYHEYIVSREIVARDLPFYALIMAAMAKADTVNMMKLGQAFPEQYAEVMARYNAPGGKLEGE